MDKENLEKDLLNQEDKQNSNFEKVDEDRTKNELLQSNITNQGVVADKFDEAPPVNATKEELESFSKKDGIKIIYNFTAKEIENGLRIFQKYTIYKKNIIYSLIIGILFLVYIFKIGMGQNQSSFDIFICVICVAVLGMIWYYPLNHIKTIVKMIEQNPIDDYVMSVYEDAVIFGENETATIIEYNSGYLKVWEDEEKFVIGYEKQRIFLIPKRCLDKNNSENISKIFKNGLGKNYTRI